MSIKDVIESADYSLGPRAFEALYRGALQLPTHEMRLKTITVLVLAGRLAMRLKACQHLREAWINWKRGELYIPPFDPCDCYRCWLEAYWSWLGMGLRRIREMDEEARPDWFEVNKRAKAYTKEKRRRIPEVAGLDSEELVEVLCTTKHDPKTPSGGRVIAFGWSPRITQILLTFFEEYDCIAESQQTIRNWVGEAAEIAGIPTEEWKIHGLRADGVSFLLRLTGDPVTTMEITGLQDRQSFNRYHRQFSVLTTKLLYRAAGREEWAPPSIPESPDELFPVALGYELMEGELSVFPDGINGDPDHRRKRAQENEDREFSLYHPRGDLHDSLPDGQAGFPDPTNLDYNRYEDHETPNILSMDIDRDDEPTITATTLEEAIIFQNSSESTIDDTQQTLSDNWEDSSPL